MMLSVRKWGKSLKILLILMLGVMLILVVSCANEKKPNFKINEESKEYYKSVQAEKESKKEKIVIRNPFKEDDNQEFQDPKIVARGQKIYMSHCFQCHGKKAKGDGPVAKYLDKKPINLIEAMKTVPDLEFFLNVSKWYGKMPGWERHLTDREVRDLAAYFLSLKKKDKNES